MTPPHSVTGVGKTYVTMTLGFKELHLFKKSNNNLTAEKCGDEPDSEAAKESHSKSWVDNLCSEKSDSGTCLRVSFKGEAPEEERELAERRNRELYDLQWLLIGVVTLAWLLGSCGTSWAWLLVALTGTWYLVKNCVDDIADDVVRFESLRVARQRALQADETCEWLNLLFNRWWVFSSDSIFRRAKAILDPRLDDAKPSFVEAISLKKLSLGERTPTLRSVRSWDLSGSEKKFPCPVRPPRGLAEAHDHSMAMLCEVALDSDGFYAILSARVGGKGMGVDMDFVVEKLVVMGRMVVVVNLDMDVPFPHISGISLSFVEKPQVWFSLKMLKTVQMMNLPGLKTWLHSLVLDALTSALVDPCQLDIPIHPTEADVASVQYPGNTLAKGVLTLFLQKMDGQAGSSSEEDKTLVLSIGGRQQLLELHGSSHWRKSCSFLLTSDPAKSTLIVKMKSKKLITSTIVQCELPLAHYVTGTNSISNIILQKKSVKAIGGSVPTLKLRMEYTELVPVNLEEALQVEENECCDGPGVLYIAVHGADDLPIMGSEGSCGSYCMMQLNRKRVKTSHHNSGTRSPQWECGVEVLVNDLTSCRILFAVFGVQHQQLKSQQESDVLGLCTLSLSSVELPFVRRVLPLTRNVVTPLSGVLNSAHHQSVSTITVSVVFRSVSAMASVNGIEEHQQSSLQVCNGVGGLSPTFSSSVFPQNLSPVESSSRKNSSFRVPEEASVPTKKKVNTKWLNSILGSHKNSDLNEGQTLMDIISSGFEPIELSVIRARNLLSKDLNGFSDPYFEIKVNGEVKHRSAVKKKTLNPEWHQSFISHFPSPGESTVIILWDYDTIGRRDFLGSLVLTEGEMKQLSQRNSPVWYTLEDVKTGEIEIKARSIATEYEDTSTNNEPVCPSSEFRCAEKSNSEDSGFSDNFTREEGKAFAVHPIKSDSPPPPPPPPRRYLEALSADINGGFTNSTDPKLSDMCKSVDSILGPFKPRTSDTSNAGFVASPLSSSLSSVHSSSKTGSDSNLSRVEQSSMDTPRSPKYIGLCTPSRARKFGKDIKCDTIATVRGQKARDSDFSSFGTTQKAEQKYENDSSKEEIRRFANYVCSQTLKTQLERDSVDLLRTLEAETSSDDYNMFKKCSKHTIPRISLTDHSEDEYGLSDMSNEDAKDSGSEKSKSKRFGEGGLKAVREKVRRRFALRRFRSEANIKDNSSLTPVVVPIDTGPPGRASSSVTAFCSGGGGESDALELLDDKRGKAMLHAKSQPNLFLSQESQSRNKSLTSSKVNGSSGPPRETFTNISGVVERAEGLHISRSGLQLFVRVRISETKGSGGGSKEGTVSTKTLGRSRLVPASPSPKFDCEWGAEGEYSKRGLLVLEVRTGSRDLLTSASVSLGDLFPEYGDEASVERWIGLQAGASILLKAKHGGEPISGSKRRSLFRSLSFYRIGRV